MRIVDETGKSQEQAVRYPESQRAASFRIMEEKGDRLRLVQTMDTWGRALLSNEDESKARGNGSSCGKAHAHTRNYAQQEAVSPSCGMMISP